ncbi:MAG: hypothetical protein H5T84_08855 [Thermoleophilia bacterium]|nr:hypothetical protein [Thermoleophilia bacterium]
MTEEQKTAEQRLQDLLAEQKALPEALQRAAQEGDVQEVERLQRRLDALPIEIRTARIMALQEKIAHLEAQIAEAAAESKRAREEAQQAYEAYRAAEKEWIQKQNAYQRANNTIHFSASEIGRLRRQLEAEMQQSAPVGPVVRSVWQQKPS